MSCADWTASCALTVSLSNRNMLFAFLFCRSERRPRGPISAGPGVECYAQSLLPVARNADFHLARFRFLALWHGHGQHAILVFGMNLLCVHRVGQGEAAAERPVAALDPQVVILGNRLLKLALPADCQQVVLDANIDV